MFGYEVDSGFSRIGGTGRVARRSDSLRQARCHYPQVSKE